MTYNVYVLHNLLLHSLVPRPLSEKLRRDAVPNPNPSQFFRKESGHKTICYNVYYQPSQVIEASKLVLTCSQRQHSMRLNVALQTQQYTAVRQDQT